MPTTQNWNSCQLICWALAVLAGLAVLFGAGGEIGIFGALLLGVVLAALLGTVFTRLVCTGDPAGEVSMSDMGRSSLDKLKVAAGVSRPSAQGASRAKAVPDRTTAARHDAEAARTGEAASGTNADPATGLGSPESALGGGLASDDAGRAPETLNGPRDGKPDNLKEIKGVGPKLEEMLNEMGVYHFDQISAWGAEEVAWVDSRLGRFKGRATRDDWIGQAKILATGGETDFSRRVDDGEVY